MNNSSSYRSAWSPASEMVADDGIDAKAPSKKKAAGAFRTISEVAEELDVQQHVLRFWETKFSQVRPLKRGGGRRYYRPEDVILLKRIHELLYTEGYTIKGVQKLLREKGKAQILQESAQGAMTETAVPAANQSESGTTPSSATPSSQPMVSSGMSVKQKATLMAVLDELKGLRGQIA